MSTDEPKTLDDYLVAAMIGNSKPRVRRKPPKTIAPSRYNIHDVEEQARIITEHHKLATAIANADNVLPVQIDPYSLRYALARMRVRVATHEGRMSSYMPHQGKREMARRAA